VLGAPAIGLSKDEGRTVASVATFADVKGPVECGGACAALWPETRAQIVARPDGGSPGLAPPLASAREREPEAKRSSCACDVIGGHDRSDHGSLTAGPLSLVALIFARRVRGSKLTQKRRSTNASRRIFLDICDLVTRSAARSP
jgi:hypothetical protein